MRTYRASPASMDGGGDCAWLGRTRLWTESASSAPSDAGAVAALRADACMARSAAIDQGWKFPSQTRRSGRLTSQRSPGSGVPTNSAARTRGGPLLYCNTPPPSASPPRRAHVGHRPLHQEWAMQACDVVHGSAWCSMQRAMSKRSHAPCSIRRTQCNRQRAPCDVPHTQGGLAVIST